MMTADDLIAALKAATPDQLAEIRWLLTVPSWGRVPVPGQPHIYQGAAIAPGPPRPVEAPWESGRPPRGFPPIVT